jgi:hypothetical protein
MRCGRPPFGGRRWWRRRHPGSRSNPGVSASVHRADYAYPLIRAASNGMETSAEGVKPPYVPGRRAEGATCACACCAMARWWPRTQKQLGGARSRAARVRSQGVPAGSNISSTRAPPTAVPDRVACRISSLFGSFEQNIYYVIMEPRRELLHRALFTTNRSYHVATNWQQCWQLLVVWQCVVRAPAQGRQTQRRASRMDSAAAWIVCTAARTAHAMAPSSCLFDWNTGAKRSAKPNIISVSPIPSNNGAEVTGRRRSL